MKVRPPILISWPLLALAVITLLAAIVRGAGWIIGAFFGVAVLIVLVTWLLAPYSRRARRLRAPTDEQFDRSRQRVEDFVRPLERIPLLGHYFRWAHQRSQAMSDSMIADYRAKLSAYRKEVDHQQLEAERPASSAENSDS
jgi:hypothetical protein